MKTVKFTPELTTLVKKGLKNVTWRIFDDKDLSENDEIILATRDGEIVTEFGEAIIEKVTVRTISTLQPEDYEGHEPVEDALESYKAYYGDRVDKDTEVKVIRFKIKRIY